MSELLGAAGTLAAKVPERNDSTTAAHKAVLNATKCSSCGMCVSACPQHAIEEPMNFCCAKCVKYCMTYEVPCEPTRIAICAERCDGCGRCIPCCPSDAIHLEPLIPELGDPVGLPLGNYFPGTRTLARVTLADLPTPVESVPELARLLGLRSLFVKRDDVSGEAYGGNKVRKLEFLLGQALAEKRKSVLTFGARGSNHVRATAVYGKQLGLKVHAVLTPQPTTPYLEGNLLADRAAGATLHFVDSHRDSVDRGAELQAQLAREDGIEPFVIPFGGTVARGTIGFVNAALELAAQVERGELPSPDVVYVLFGSMGTASGLATGFAALGLPIAVIAVRVVPAEIASLALARRVVQDAVALLRESDPGFPRLDPESAGLRVRDAFFGDSYASPTTAAREAVELASAHGLRLETTYTGKALAALVADARADQLTGKTAVFWNTYSSRPIRRE